MVIPCLNEIKTLPFVITAAQRGLQELGVSGEIIVADNGSTDGSQKRAQDLGARVVTASEKGYGSALQAGIRAALGHFVIFADADGSYDLSQMKPFVGQLRLGAGMVMGNRLSGDIEAGAMPWLHRYIGTPVLTFLINIFFKTNISDCNCGMRGIRRDAFENLRVFSPGMEFASEMVIKAGLLGMNIREVPISFEKDKRDRRPHLRTWSDGWRHLRLILIYAPNYLFIYPGSAFFFLGSALLFIQIFGPVQIGPIFMDLHFMIFGLMQSIVGLAIFLMGATIKQFSEQHDYYVKDVTVNFFEYLGFERKLILGISCFLLGFFIITTIIFYWIGQSFTNPNMLRSALFGLYFLSTGMLIGLFSLLELVMRTKR